MIQLQDYTNTIKHVPSEWADLEYDHMYHKFWGGCFTYMGKYVNNKNRVKFTQVNRIASKKAILGEKVTRTASSKKYVSQGNSRD